MRTSCCFYWWKIIIVFLFVYCHKNSDFSKTEETVLFVYILIGKTGNIMAENEQTGGNNLDDFFAKKDKSKKKTKSSKFTVDDILQAKTENEEKSQKVRSSKKKEKDASRSDKSLGVKTEGVI